MRGIVLCIAVILCAGTAGGDLAPETDAAGASPASSAADGAEPGLIEVFAGDYEFLAPPTFPSGWVNLRFENAGAEPHFLLIWALPEGKTFDDWFSEVVQPFGAFYARYRSGELDRAAFLEQLVAAMPEWFYSAVPMGGPGFTAPGRTSETAIYLEPGDNYVMECYVRAETEDDSFHSSHGMLRPLIVTDEPSGMEPPPADVEITLSSFEIAVEGDLSPGRHVVRVGVADTPEGFVKHNVHLVKLDGDMTAGEVAPWLNWVDAMLPPAPAQFLGGAGQTVAGRESYLTVDLEPGRYAWVSEIFGVQGMVHELTVRPAESP